MKSTNKWNCEAYYNYLSEQVPRWENDILRDWDNPYSPNRQDVRFLPNKYRSVYSLIESGIRTAQISERLCRSRSTIRRQYLKACSLVRKRLNDWLDSLTESRRRKEIEKRLDDKWIGKVSTSNWSDHIQTIPDLSEGWKNYRTSS